MLETVVTVIHVLVALFMILVVLVQGGNSGGVGAAFGGGNSSGVLGATGAQTLLSKMTYGVAIVFMITSVSLSVIQGNSGKVGLKEKLQKASTTEQVDPKAAEPAAEEPKQDK